MRRGRELYREGTPENIKRGYTDLVYGGDNVTVDKGVISAEGSGGGGGGLTLYGPYIATNPESISVAANASEEDIALSDLKKDIDFSPVSFPDTEGATLISRILCPSQCTIGSIRPAIYAEWVPEWQNAFANLHNNSSSPVFINVGDLSVVFFSTVEFPPAGE